MPLVDSSPSGYPHFATFLASHQSFHIFRRFAVLRVRLMLHKQDQLSALEQQLQQVDREESKLLFLGSMRLDKNSERKQLFNEIDVALAEYGRLIVFALYS